MRMLSTFLIVCLSYEFITVLTTSFRDISEFIFRNIFLQELLHIMQPNCKRAAHLIKPLREKS